MSERRHKDSTLPPIRTLRAVLLPALAGVFITSLFALSVVWQASGKSTVAAPQGPDLDYSKFSHSSQRHASLGCTSCHQRGDNSAKPTFPGHKACTTCHLAQFVTPMIPMCNICHSDTKGTNPPLKGFPITFKEGFNVKFDHAQHLTGSARPQAGCTGCHERALNRGAALSIPAGLAAHGECYVCHTPASKSAGGREIASCGVCHELRGYVRPSTNAPAFRASFSHAQHGPRQRLGCADCHTAAAGAPLSKQVSSPRPLQHFASGGLTCTSCHNGKKSFGGDLAFKDCKRCHTGPTFRVAS